MAGERPVIPAAEFLSDTFSGIADAISGLGDSFANNDALDVILRRHLESKNMNMSGFSVRHYDRSGSIEYKLKGHSVEQGLADDVLYYSKHDELIQWAAENRPELIPASLMPSAPPPTAAAPSVGTPSVAVDKDAALRTYLEEYGKERQLEAERSVWEKKHVGFGDFHDEAFRNSADRMGVSDYDLLQSLKSHDLYNEHIKLEGHRENPRWFSSSSYDGMSFDEAEAGVQKRLAEFMKNTAGSPVAPGYQTTDDLIKDFTTKASSPQADEAGAILKDVFDRTDFTNKEFDIPGSTRSVTGSDVLGKLSGIEITDQIGGVAAYHPESGRMLVNRNLLGSLQPEEIATTFTHELFHTAADVSGSLDPERLNKLTAAGSAMTPEDAKYIGQQEGIADSFSRRTNARSWLYPGG